MQDFQAGTRVRMDDMQTKVTMTQICVNNPNKEAIKQSKAEHRQNKTTRKRNKNTYIFDHLLELVVEHLVKLDLLRLETNLERAEEREAVNVIITVGERDVAAGTAIPHSCSGRFCMQSCIGGGISQHNRLVSSGHAPTVCPAPVRVPPCPAVPDCAVPSRAIRPLRYPSQPSPSYRHVPLRPFAAIPTRPFPSLPIMPVTF